ncbi:hypothetical protein BGX23_004776 [Mortierella sp. AD031]|nr:hypothetical protein BGX23_004776 [Mortierella sp. AD031]
MNNSPAHTSYTRSSNGRGRRWDLGRRVVATLTLLSIINPLVSHSRIGHSLIQGQAQGSSFGLTLSLGLGVAAVPVVQPSKANIVERQDPAPSPSPAPVPPVAPPAPATPIEVDPCTTLSELLEPYITWGHVKRCYEGVPYNATEANNVVSTMFTLFRDFYIFLDSATTRNLPKPFTSPPPFELYAPVVDKVQSIRILTDSSGNFLEDCQVLTIDGVNALDAIQAWVDINYGFSKDAGVRLNKALTSHTFNSETKKWTVNAGQFNSRVTLPERAEVVYEIQCPVSQAFPQVRNHTMKAPWEVYRLVSWNDFDNTETFLTQNCYRDTDPRLQKNRVVIESAATRKAEQLRNKASRRQESLYQAAIETPRHLTKEPRFAIEKRQLHDVPIARLLSNGSSTSFYQLIKRPSIGVVVIPTHAVSLKTEGPVLEDGFSQLYEAGVRNIILDLTSNGGGYVNFAYDLVDWMFPQENVTSVYVSDLRTSMSVKAIAQTDLGNEEYDSYFNPSSYSDPITEQEHESNFFLKDQLIRRANRQLDYSPKVRMNHNLGEFEMGMPWQHDTERIVVLTDGACGSACGMSLNRLKNRHGVKSYAVGGRHGEDLSLFSFAGASVYSLDEILEDYEMLGVDPPMQQLRYKGIYRVPVMEFFDDDETRPIEFRTELYKADFHLDYTPITARRHEVLWEIVANNHWAPKG